VWLRYLRTHRPPNRCFPQPLLFAAVARLTYSLVMSGSDKRKQSLYFPEEMLKEIGDEATRQDRSLSWIVQKAWKAARKEIMSIPSVNDIPSDSDKDAAKKGTVA
jgi:uncharacterized small protein (TIGR04563 family)